jgi:hypothetical protein
MIFPTHEAIRGTELRSLRIVGRLSFGFIRPHECGTLLALLESETEWRKLTFFCEGEIERRSVMLGEFPCYGERIVESRTCSGDASPFSPLGAARRVPMWFGSGEYFGHIVEQ